MWKLRITWEFGMMNICIFPCKLINCLTEFLLPPLNMITGNCLSGFHGFLVSWPKWLLILSGWEGNLVENVCLGERRFWTIQVSECTTPSDLSPSVSLHTVLEMQKKYLFCFGSLSIITYSKQLLSKCLERKRLLAPYLNLLLTWFLR